MSYHLDPKKEEEIKTLLRTNSVREIVAKTGVSKGTITRITRENFTEEERAAMKKRGMKKAHRKRNLAKGRGGDVESKKICNKCKKEKPLDQFSRNAGVPDGYDRTCKSCWVDIRADKRKAQSVGPNDKGSVIESLFIDPTAIRSIKRSVGKEILADFSKFLEERWG